MQAPLVSIITPTYNSANTLDRTIKSVLEQTYPHIEYIIMDGASTDHTRDVVAPYLSDERVTFISEPDSGQSNAINKGWAQAKGDILAWLCADDLYSPNTVSVAVNALNTSDCGWVYGQDRYINAHGDPVPFKHHIAQWNYENYLSQALYISQPTTFWRREVYERFGPLREDLNYTMDMEYFLRIGKDYPGCLIDQVMATITWTRDTKTFSGGRERILEMAAVATQYGATEFADTVRVQWADAHLEDSVRLLAKGRIGEAMTALKGAFRYPTHVPKGVAKLLVRNILSEQLETRLRRALFS